jgi:hypothetical protein
MPRVTITIPKNIYNRLSALLMLNNDSMSTSINRLMISGVQAMSDPSPSNILNNGVEQHCHQLIIQMNALLKSISAETIKFKQEDFEKLRHAAMSKYYELLQK